MTRRDKLFIIGRRMAALEQSRAHDAWQTLAGILQQLGDKDLPKFKDLTRAIRQATIVANQPP